MNAGRRCFGIRLAVLLTLVSANQALSAGESWLTFEGNHECSAAPAELATRIEELVAGTQSGSLKVHIAITHENGATTAVVKLWSGSRSAGSKRLVAPSCAEALDSVVAVVALALSGKVEDTTAPSRQTTLPARVSELAYPKTTGESAESRASVVLDRSPSMPRDSERRLWLAGGLDQGTFEAPMAFLGIGAAHGLARGELRWALWYGMASRTEEVMAEVGERRESKDHAAISLDYCHGVDRGRWLAACAGLEAGAAWRSSFERDSSGRTTKTSSFVPIAGPSVGTLFVFRDAPVQPELSISAKLLAWGGPESGLLALRATLGAAVPF